MSNHGKGISRTILILAVGLFISSLGFSFLSTVMPLYAELLGMDAKILGSVYSLYNVSYVIAVFYTGILADKYPRAKLVSGGLLLFGFSTALMAVIATPFQFGVLRVLEGVGSAIITPAVLALTMDLAHERRRGEILGFVSTVQMIGAFVGPSVGGFLADMYTLETPFYFTALIAVVAAVVIFPLHEAKKTTSGRQYKGVFSALKENIAQNDTLKVISFRAFAIGMMQGVFSLIIVLYFSDKLGFSSFQLGIISLAQGITIISFTYLFGRVSDRVGRKPLIITGGIIIAVGVYIYTWAHTHLQVYLTGAFIGAGIAMNNPAIQALTADVTLPELRGKILGSLQVIMGSGRILGLMLLGILYQDVSHESPLYLLSLLMVTTVLLVMFFTKETVESALTT